MFVPLSDADGGSDSTVVHQRDKHRLPFAKERLPTRRKTDNSGATHTQSESYLLRDERVHEIGHVDLELHRSQLLHHADVLLLSSRYNATTMKKEENRKVNNGARSEHEDKDGMKRYQEKRPKQWKKKRNKRDGDDHSQND